MGNGPLCPSKHTDVKHRQQHRKLRHENAKSSTNVAAPSDNLKDTNVSKEALPVEASAAGGAYDEDSCTRLVHVFRVPKFKQWQKLFHQHSKNSTLGKGALLYSFPFSRSAYCREAGTVVFRDVGNPSIILVTMDVLDMDKFSKVLGTPDAVMLKRDLGIADVVPLKSLVDPPGAADEQAEAAAATEARNASPSILSCKELTLGCPPGPKRHDASTPSAVDCVMMLEVDDFDWWYAGFTRHAISNKGSWGFAVSSVRADWCDESKTRVFRGVNAPNKVAVCLYGVNMAKYRDQAESPSILRLRGALGEKEDTRTLKRMVEDESLQLAHADADNCSWFTSMFSHRSSQPIGDAV